MGFNGDLYQESGADVVMTTKGDLVRYNTERERYGIGSAGQVLQVASSLPTWSTINLADSVLTTQGDVLYEGASALARLGQSTNNYTLATKGSGQNPAWQASSTSVLTTTGDLLYASGANTLARLASVSSGQVLTSQGVGSAPAWAVAGGGGAWSLIASQTSAGTSIDTTALSDCDNYEVLDFWATCDVDTASTAEMQLYDSTDTLLTSSYYMNSGFAYGAFASDTLVDSYHLNLGNTTGTEDIFIHGTFYNKGFVGDMGMGFITFNDRVNGGCAIGVSYKGAGNTIRGMKLIEPTSFDNAYWYLLGA